jgi:hypothetical protein
MATIQTVNLNQRINNSHVNDPRVGIQKSSKLQILKTILPLCSTAHRLASNPPLLLHLPQAPTSVGAAAAIFSIYAKHLAVFLELWCI